MIQKAKCNNCGDVIRSLHRHDFVSCSCFQWSEKRIYDYIESNYELNDISYLDDPKYKALVENLRGFFLDGGGEYTRIGGNEKDITWLPEEENE